MPCTLCYLGTPLPLRLQRSPRHDHFQYILHRRVSPQPNTSQGRCCFNKARMIKFMRFLLLLLLLVSLPVHPHAFCGNDFRWRPYRVEYTGSLPTSEVKQHRARLVLGWGTAWEHLRVLPAFSFQDLLLPKSFSVKSSASFGRTKAMAQCCPAMWAGPPYPQYSPGARA